MIFFGSCRATQPLATARLPKVMDSRFDDSDYEGRGRSRDDKKDEEEDGYNENGQDGHDDEVHE